ncbi:MAG: acetylserotonin O-methyltransferase [Planctomycetales bacterium]
MTNETPDGPPPAARLMQMIVGHWVTAAIYAATKLKLFDQLHPDAKDSDAVAEESGANPSAVFRLLRALASVGVVEEKEPRRFALTELGDLLREDHPQSMRGMALFQGAPPHWRGWGEFLHSVQTGESAFEHVHGKGFFDYCETDEEFSAHFNDAMTAMSAGAAASVLDAYDFTGIKRLVDVGGGHGFLIASILQRFPDLQGVVFDLPHVIQGTPSRLEAAGVQDRCETIGGSFLEEVPSGDAYVLKHIIHDWDDEHSRTILTNIRGALDGDGKVLLIEAVIPPGNDPSLAKLVDLEMLHATHGGRERPEEEFAALFDSAGLVLSRVVPTQSQFSVVEAKLKKS